MHNMKESYLFLAAGFEEVEALTCVDVLRRAGIPVKTVSITDSLQVEGANGITVTADTIFSDTNFDDALWLITPGGMPGAENLYNYEPLARLITAHARAKGKTAAICAAPGVVLGQLGLLKGERATCYPGFEKFMKGATVEDLPVVISHNFVTGNGPANAMLWALAIVAETLGNPKSEEIASGLLFYPPKTNDIDFTWG